MRVIVDFVMNHTSDQHPWFKSARRSSTTPTATLRVGADGATSSGRTWSSPTRRTASGSSTRGPASGSCTTSTRRSPTSMSPIPLCRRRSRGPSASGCELGVAGFRVDAVPFMFAHDAYPGPSPTASTPQRYLGDVRDFVVRRTGDAALLGEVNLPYEEQKGFFGGADGDGLNMQFDFIGMQRSTSRWPGRTPTHRDGPARAPELDITASGPTSCEPRRAHPRQAQRLRAPGGLRRLRPRARHAALRPRPATAAADDARRRPAPPAPRLLADVSLPGTPSSSTGRRSAWARTSTSRAGWRCAPRCSGCRPQRRLLHGARPSARPPSHGLWSPSSRRPGPAPGPDSLWTFMRTVIRSYRQMPQIGWSDVEVLDHDHPACWPTCAAATTGACWPSTTSPRHPHGDPRARRGARGLRAARAAWTAGRTSSRPQAGSSCASTGTRDSGLRVVAPGSGPPPDAALRRGARRRPGPPATPFTGVGDDRPRGRRCRRSWTLRNDTPASLPVSATTPSPRSCEAEPIARLGRGAAPAAHRVLDDLGREDAAGGGPASPTARRHRRSSSHHRRRSNHRQVQEP